MEPRTADDLLPKVRARYVAAGCAAVVCATLVAGCGGVASDGTWDVVPADERTWVQIGSGVADGQDRGVAFRGVLSGGGDDLQVEWCATAASGGRDDVPGLSDLLCLPGTTRARVDGDTLTLTRGTLTVTLTRR